MKSRDLTIAAVAFLAGLVVGATMLDIEVRVDLPDAISRGLNR